MTPLLVLAEVAVPAAVLVVGTATVRDRHRRSHHQLSERPAPLDQVTPVTVPASPPPARRQLPRDELRAWVERGLDLEDVDLERADLVECDLSGHDFAHLSLFKACLARADLTHCRMVATDLSYAELRGADLRHADLRAANLLDADLGRADLRGANLSSARHLSSTVLRRARFDRTTQWPAQFDPDQAGARRQPYK